MAVELSQLLEDRPALVTARPDERVAEAMERMLEHDYSQLPVVTEHPSGVGLSSVGLITTTAVARAALHLGEPPSALRVHHALERGVPKAKVSDVLWDTLDHARDGVALLVEDADGRLQGLLTGYDFTAYLRVLSEDTLAVADVETTIKQLVRRHFTDDDSGLKDAVMEQVRGLRGSSKRDVQKVVRECLNMVGVPDARLKGSEIDGVFDRHFLSKVETDFERLNFGQFTDIFLGDACWADYEAVAGLPGKSVRQLLETVRELRNRLMHNRGVLGAAERDRVRYCRDLLGRLADHRIGVAARELPLPADPVEAHVVPVPDVQAEDPESGVEGPFDALVAALAAVGKEEKRLMLTFAQLDELVEGGLPQMARQHRSWWNNDDESSQGAAWAAARWRVSEVNLSQGYVVFVRTTELEHAYIRSFNEIFAALKRGGISAVPDPNGATWFTLRGLPISGPVAAHLIVKFTRNARFAVSLWIDGREKDVNKATFDELHREASALEQEVGEALVWERLDDKQSSRVSAFWSGTLRIRTGEEDLGDLCAWAERVVPRFMQVFDERYRTIEPAYAYVDHGARA